ncbi:hypothetical protein BO86DRAFT_355679 [Aspergillus japonicus CBS 114.51]|uniref:Zn(2)-C6 fungal-type domain-containing protein n=1 Tax=Aspergillus japonicus CBS 114.51 TaxID=1448312 RepID=A0A8T8XC49_ASPJA|nr:hypothetical protein BO86DRAFT_355679 [Aspergillus japonicus CBS 114.51]RAH84959.1 hypothetical protein BO86DRAFT_355679 [Aspergillus japonicus CBS 114.51]
MPRKQAATKKRHAVEDHSSASELNLTGSKRQKRGKYVSQACDQCQQRKIKCDGLLLCTPCAVYGRTCGKRSTDMRRRSARNQADAIQDRGSARRRDSLETAETVRSHSTIPLHNPLENHGHDGSPTTRELAFRLEHLEQMVHRTLDTLALHSATVRGERHPVAVTASRQRMPSGGTRSSTTPRQNELMQSQPPSFSGETSIQYTLNQVEGDLVRSDRTFETAIAHSPTRRSTPALTPVPSSPDAEATSREASDLDRLLHKHGIEADRVHWDEFLHIFCNEIHTMYPLLHLPTLWHRYTQTWTTWSLGDTEPSMPTGRHKQFVVAQLLICLATGRCTASPRIAGAEARHSAGWSLYRAAAELVGDILDCFEECSDQILVLQTLALMVIYLFRLDMINKAEKLLAIAISHAHYLGLHRSQPVIEGLTPSEIEINRRLWWCLYTMDRRLAIDTGRPFLIQDINVNTPLPQDLHDDYLFYRRVDSVLSLVSALQTPNRATGAVTPIPYLTAMVTYSRVLGKVWEGMYGADSVLQPSPRDSPLLREHFEHLISRAQEEIPPEFVYHLWQRGSHSKQPVEWLAKQQTLMRVRWLSLRLLIRRPMLQEATSSPAAILTRLDNEQICAQIADDVIQECIEIPEEQTVSTYPFFHYLLSAAIISIGLIIKQPSYKDAFGDITVKAIQVLEAYPRRTWVSGKLIRNVSKLGHIVRRVMARGARSSPVVTDRHDPPKGLTPVLHKFPASHTDKLPPSPVSRNPEPSSYLRLKAPAHRHHRVSVQDNSVTSGSEVTTAPSYIQAPSNALPNLGMTDCDHEDLYLAHDRNPSGNGVHVQSNARCCAHGPPLRSHEATTTVPEEDDACWMSLGSRMRQSPPTERSFECADRAESVVQEMKWLEALFGSYLDSNLIVRPGE